MIPKGISGKPAAGAPAGFHPAPYSDRSLPPEETWARIEPHLPLHGITRMARMTGLDFLGIPVWNAIMPNARSLAVAQGKGITDMDARLSAAMEALERVVASAPHPAPFVATAAELASRTIRALRLPELTAAGAADLAQEDTILWQWGTELLSGERVAVPREAVILDRSLPSSRFWQSSDGLASGNTPLEAQFHGLMERIERDAESLFHFLKPAARAARVLDPRTLGDPLLDDLVDTVRNVGLAVMFFDMTTDTGIPVLLCHMGPGDITARRHVAIREVTGGAGAHPNPVRAAIRALTEAAQSRITFISGTRDDIDPAIYDAPAATWIVDAFALPAAARPSWPAMHSGLDAMMHASLGRIARCGLGPVIAVSLGDPDLPFSVEKILVPGLEHPPGARLRRFGTRALMAGVGA